MLIPEADAYSQTLRDLIEKIVEEKLAATTGVPPGVYTNASITVGADGRLRFAESGSGGGGGASFYLAGMSQKSFTTFGTEVMTLGGTTNSSGSGFSAWPTSGTRHGIKPAALGIYIAVAQMCWEAVGSGSYRVLTIGQEDDDESSYVRLAQQSVWYDSTSLTLYQNVTYLVNHTDPDTHYVAIAQHSHAGSIKAAPSGVSNLASGNWLSMLGPL